MKIGAPDCEEENRGKIGTEAKKIRGKIGAETKKSIIPSHLLVKILRGKPYMGVELCAKQVESCF